MTSLSGSSVTVKARATSTICRRPIERSATGLDAASAESGDEERIEVVRWPLEDLDGAIGECRDAKSLIGLLIFRDLEA